MHELAHSVYHKHVYNGTVTETFFGDNLFGAARTIPIEERVDIDFKGFKNYLHELKEQWVRLVAVVLQQSSAVGRLFEGVAATTGAGRGTTTTISDSVIFPTANPTMGLLAAMEATEMAETMGSARVLYVDP